MRRIFLAVFSPMIIFVLTGCAAQGIMTLQRLSISQQEFDEEVETQKKSFFLLRDDFKNNRLKNGMSKQEILAKYGEPVFSRVVNDATERKEVLVYRHPTEYFSSDLIYLYLNQKQQLCFWELKVP